MGMYRIRRRWQEETELLGGKKYWRQAEEDYSADLSLDEIAELNRLSAEDSPRRGWLSRLLPGLLAVIALMFLLGLDVLPFLRGVDLGFLARSGQLAKDEALASLKSAVVSVEGPRSSGSGFNLRADGLIVTNRHVVEDNTATTVIFADGSRYVAGDWQYVEGYDLAVAGIRGENLPHVELAAELPQAGDKLIFIGNPLGFDWTISEAEMLELWQNGEDSALIFAGPVRPGSSGSPLFNAQGQVVAVIFASFAEVADRGLAIPAQLLIEYAE